MTGPLETIIAKSADRGHGDKPELLTSHSRWVRATARVVADRIASPGVLANVPGFWRWAEWAALLHDAGKTAAGFQAQLLPGGRRWGKRHELLSLGFVAALLVGAPSVDRLMVATGVAFHHRPLAGGSRSLEVLTSASFSWEDAFGRDPEARPGLRAQVRPEVYESFLAWFAAELGLPVPAPDGRRLWQRARDQFAGLAAHWELTDPDDGLVAVLLQGAVTLADHAASAHVKLQRHMPLRRDYLDSLASPYPHQCSAGVVDGHLIVRAPTGSGKTEAGLGWAARQLLTMPGEPRVVWTLPYRASIDAIAQRFSETLSAAPGEEQAEIGIVHGKVAQTLLGWATEDDAAPNQGTARKSVARAGAARLFVHRMRVATPYQLLRAAIAGPTCSSLLLEQANCLFVLDELHAYDPDTFGRLCASMRLWERLGSRVSVLSATLAPQLAELICESLSRPTVEVDAPTSFAPDRHRLVVDDEPVDSRTSIARISRWLGEGHSVLVVANTVGMARQLFDELAPVAHELMPGDPDAALMLHSRFRACDRSDIEGRLRARHPEREEGQQAGRRGGLVVATQTVEVSLCLDLDRGVTQVAPVESVVQRMGRVNRRGYHPEGRVDFHVHSVERVAPYPRDAVDVAWNILSEHDDGDVTEQKLGKWLAAAYDSPWGQRFVAGAREAREDFAAGFLNFAEPFLDRSHYASRLEERFDTVEVLHARDIQEYEERLLGSEGHPLLAARLLIPVRYRQMLNMTKDGTCRYDQALSVHVVDGVDYDPTTGLDLASASDLRRPRETVL